MSTYSESMAAYYADMREMYGLRTEEIDELVSEVKRRRYAEMVALAKERPYGPIPKNCDDFQKQKRRPL